MMMRLAGVMAAVAGMAVGAAALGQGAAAQPASQPAGQPGNQAAGQPAAGAGILAPAPTPQWPQIFERDAQGRVASLGGNLDAVALTKNTLLKPGDLEKMKPAIEEWTADVNQMAIDHQDLLDRLEVEKLVDTLDLNDTQRGRIVSQIMAPLAAQGSLTQRLEQRGVISKEASVLNQQSSVDYLQKIFEEMQSGASLPGRGEAPSATQQDQLNDISRFLYYMSNRDVRIQYHAILRDAAKMLDQVAASAGVTAEQKPAFDAEAAKVKGAKDDVERIQSMKGLLRTIDMPQRRALLMAAVEKGAAKDVFNFPPVVPHPYAR